jgi:hypothetical protein
LPFAIRDHLSLPDSQLSPITQQAVPASSTLPSARQASERLLALTSLGGLLLAVGLALIAAELKFRVVIYLVFLFMLGLAPPLAAGLVVGAERVSAATRSRLALLFGASRSLLLLILIIVDGWIILVAMLGPPFPFGGLTAVSLVLVGGLGVGTLLWRWGQGSVDAGLVIAAGLAVFLLSPFTPSQDTPIGLLAYAIAAPGFAGWALAGALWTAIGVWLRQRAWSLARHRWLQPAMIVLASVVALGLYDDTHLVDFYHFLPLVGPAMHAERAGVPLVDVYSQYGFLPWALYWLAFDIFQPTYGTAAVVVRVLNVAYYATFVAILVQLSQRQLSAMWFLIPAFLVAVTSHSNMWNMNALPMALGGRNLVPALMALVLVAARRRRHGPVIALGLIAVAAISSLEILAFTVAPWGGCLLLDSVRERSWQRLLRGIVQSVIIVALAQLVMVAVIWARSGAILCYDGYLELFFQYHPTEDSIWSVPFEPYYALWFPIGLAYFGVLALAWLRAFRGYPDASLVEQLVPAALLGLGPLAYFFGRPQEGALSISCLSFAVVAIAIAEEIFFRPARFGPAGKALSGVLAVGFAFTIADGFEHFMRPIDPLKGNATVLRRCLGGEGCTPGAVARNISLALHTGPLDRRTQVGGWLPDDSRQRIEEVTAELRRLDSQNHRKVGLLTDIEQLRFPEADTAISVASFMATRQWFPWPLSAPNNDELSPVLVERILLSVAGTPSGTPIIASNDRVRWKKINELIWTTLSKHCRLVPAHRGRYYTTFVTESCA